MSPNNVEVVRLIWDAAARPDTEAVFALYAPDVELDVSGFPLVATEHTVYRGHEGLRSLFGEWREVWEDADSRLEELIDAGERVISVYTYGAQGRSSGIRLEGTFASVWTVRRGKAARVEWFTDRAQALEAAGLRE